MKSLLLSLTLLSLLLPAENAYSQEYRYNLPHVANGSFGQGSFRTTFVLFNNSDDKTYVQLKLTGDDGTPLPVTIPGLGTDSSFGFYLEVGASRILQTDGSGSLAVGAAFATSSPADIGVSSIFSIYDNDGDFVTEAGVGNSEPLQYFMVPVDATGAFNTGLALFNPDKFPASVSLVLLDSSGAEISRTDLTPPLAGGAHLARFVAGPGQLFPNVSDFRGMLAIRTSVPICALTLRQNASTPSPTYTSLPVTSLLSIRTRMSFPQAVNGAYGSIVFKTSFLIENISASPAHVVLALTQDDGSPFVVTVPGAGTGSSFNLTLERGASVFLQTDGNGPGTAGAATVTSDVPIGAASIFTVLNSQGQFQTEAGVGGSPALTSMTLPVDVTGNFETGVAFHNPGSAPVTLTLRLLDAGGFETGPIATLALEANGHTAKFVSQLFPGTGNFQGSLAISAPAGVAALTLRQNGSPLSYTTLPVAFGAAVGQGPTRPLLTDRMTGVTVDREITVDRALASGYLLSGSFTGEGMLRSVTAASGSGSILGGFVDFSSHKYTVVVPAGTHTIGGMFARDTDSGGVFMKFSDTEPVQVSGNTVKDIALPVRSLFRVSGTVGIGSLNPAMTWPTVKLTSIDQSVATADGLGSDGAFSVSLPAGDYRVSLGGSFGPEVSGALYDIGSVSVGGDVVNASFTVPATAVLSGQVNISGLQTIGYPVFVDAVDASAPTDTQSVYLSPFSVSTAQVDPAGGPYRLILARNRTHNVQARVRVPGSLFFPAGTGMQITLGSDTVVDLNLPDPGEVFTISGRVSDALGRCVKEVVVEAVSQSLAATPQLSSEAAALTDANGFYRLMVPAGSYRLIFTPPIPVP